MSYQPLRYGSKEYMALRKTEQSKKWASRVAGRAVTIEKKWADRPGLWTVDSAEIYEVLVKGPGVYGLSSISYTVMAWAATEDEAKAKAEEAFRKEGAR